MMRTVSQWQPARILIACSVALLAPTIARAADTRSPSISGFNQTRVPLGSNLLIYGSAFRDAQGRGYVLVGGRQVPVLAWSDGAISVLVNPQAFNHADLILDTTYPVQVVVPDAPTPKTKTIDLMVTSDPLITGFLGTTFKSGDAIRIYGARFGVAQGAGNIWMSVVGVNANGTPITQPMSVKVKTWGDNAIDAQFTLPTGMPVGLYALTVQRNDGAMGSNTLTVLPK